MLPPELVKLITDLLDIRSVCALAQSSKTWSSAIIDSVFRDKLEKVCPWFEPQFSHRNTWRECAIEYCRRRQPGAKYARSIRKVDAAEFGHPLTTSIGTESEKVNKALLGLHGNVYTSRYGIRLDLSGHRDIEEIHILASFAHVLTVAVHLPRAKCHLLVKYKGSEGAQPDIERVFKASSQVYCHVLGRHVFASFSENTNMYEGSDILYVNSGDIVGMASNEPPMGFTCYDGLLLFFNGESYTSARADLETDNLCGFLEDMKMTDDFVTGCTLTYPDYKVAAYGSGYYLVEDDHGKRFVVDDARGIMACAVEVGEHRFQVISDAQRRALDEANEFSKQKEILAAVK